MEIATKVRVKPQGQESRESRCNYAQFRLPNM